MKHVTQILEQSIGPVLKKQLRREALMDVKTLYGFKSPELIDTRYQELLREECEFTGLLYFPGQYESLRQLKSA